MKYFAALGIALLVIAAASVGPWAPSPFTSQTGTNTTAAAWRVALGVTSSASLTNAALVGGTVVNQTNTSLTAARVLVTDANKVPTNSAVTTTTLGYLDATSSIQTQLDAKPTAALTNLAKLDTANIYTAGQTVSSGKISSTDGFNASGNLAFYIGGSTLVGYFQAAGSHFNVTGDGYFGGANLVLGAQSGFQVSMAKSGNNILLSPAATAGYVGITNLVATNITTSSLVVGGGAAVTGVLSATATLNFDLTALVVEDLTITVTGAASGDTVSIGVPAGSVTATVQFTGWVSAADTVTIRARTSVVGENPASGTFRATVTKF